MKKNRGCNFFKWVESQTYVCCDRVMGGSLKRDLKSERAMEVFKCKTKIAQ